LKVRVGGRAVVVSRIRSLARDDAERLGAPIIGALHMILRQ
jgi:hypothetical protein